jgi:hypothetical protein
VGTCECRNPRQVLVDVAALRQRRLHDPNVIGP